MKTYRGWLESDANTIEEYLNVGDIVDEEMYLHFLNIMPPLIDLSNLLQTAEPYDFVGGKATYLTFEKVDGQWTYRGNCYKGETENK